MTDFDTYTEIFKQTSLQVQNIKKGDINYLMLCKEITLKELIKENEDLEISYFADNNNSMANFCEGKRKGYESALQMLQDLYKSINQL